MDDITNIVYYRWYYKKKNKMYKRYEAYYFKTMLNILIVIKNLKRQNVYYALYYIIENYTKKFDEKFLQQSY